MWKRRINQTLARLTGYELRQAGKPEPSPERPQQPRKAAAGRADPVRRPAPRRNRRMPRHYDQEAKEIVWRVKRRTMTSHEKLYGLILATRYIGAYKVPGAVVECGVWRGGSMQAVAYTLLENGISDRDLHLYDTYEGMPPPTEKDRRGHGKGATAAELLAAADKDAPVWAVAPLDDVKQAMEETGYPAERVHFHKGLVEETIPSEAPDEISLLRLDTDWYESTRHELEHLYDRLSPGGVLIIDDYGDWAGSRQATDEFLAKTGAPLLLLPLKTARIAVKPWA